MPSDRYIPALRHVMELCSGTFGLADIDVFAAHQFYVITE
jgi:hypothetical protein